MTDNLPTPGSDSHDEGTEEYSQIYDIEQLFAIPLVATVNADIYAAKRFVNYLRQYGFKNGEGDNWGELRTVKFTYNTTNAQGIIVHHKIEIPIISLVPLPLLQVKNAEYKMEINILGRIQHVKPPQLTEPSDTDEYDELDGENRIKAMLSPLKQSESNPLAPNLSANLRANITMRQADIPSGIATLLGLTQEANTGTSKLIQDRLSVIPDSINLSRSPMHVELTLVDAHGKAVINSHIETHIERGADWLVISPSHPVTDNEGKVEVHISTSHPPTINQKGLILFKGGNSNWVKLNIIWEVS